MLYMSQNWQTYISEYEPIERKEKWLTGDGVIPNEEIDDVLTAVVASVVHHGGEATTSEVKSETGLTNQKILYRFTKLEQYDIAEITQKERSQHGIPPKVCRLTEKGIFAVEHRGLGGNEAHGHESVTRADQVTVTKEQLHDFQQELKGLENRLNAMRSMPDPDVSADSELADRVQEIESAVDTLNSAAVAMFRCLEEEFGVDPREYVPSDGEQPQ